MDVALAVLVGLLLILFMGALWVLPMSSIAGEAELAEARRKGVEPARPRRLAHLVVPIIVSGSIISAVSYGFVYASALIGVGLGAWFASFWLLVRWGWNRDRLTARFVAAATAFTGAGALAVRFTDLFGPEPAWGDLGNVLLSGAVLLILPSMRRIALARSRRRPAT